MHAVGLIILRADSFGIYGNPVVNHGYSLVYVYGHLSSVDISERQEVARGDTLGRKGETDLAGGDPLHFAIFLHGLPVG